MAEGSGAFPPSQGIMMNETLIVTCFNRPQALYRCLRSIGNCDLPNVQVVVSEDVKPRPPQVEIMMKLAITAAREYLDFEHVQRFDSITNWDNIHRALDEAKDSDLIYFVEDDYVVEPTFVEWHRKVQEQFQPFASFAETLQFKSEDPAGVVATYSNASVRAGCMSSKSLRTLLDQRWTRHFEEVLHNHIIYHRELVIFPTLARAHDTGEAGVNLGARDVKVTFTNPPTPDTLHVAVDLREAWPQAYQAQAQWDF
jgi:hypothetical protein